MRLILSILLTVGLGICNLSAQNDTLPACPLAPGLPRKLPDTTSVIIPISVSGLLNDTLGQNGQNLCGVRVTFEHEYLGDLTMQLQAPNGGAQIELLGPVGLFGMTDLTNWDVLFVPCGTTAQPDSGFSSVWNSEAIWSIGQNYTGSYHPYSGCLEDFQGFPANGLWTFTATDNQSIDSGYLYRVELIFCDTTGLSCLPSPDFVQAAFTATPTGASVAFQNQSIRALEYQWTFGDGTGSSEVDPVHVYADTGSFTVQLIASGWLLHDTAVMVVHVEEVSPIAGFLIDPHDLCAPLAVQFIDASSNVPTAWHWTFPGGQPSESLEQNPEVIYLAAGIYPVELIVSNGAGSDTLYQPAAVQAMDTVAVDAQAFPFAGTDSVRLEVFVSNGDSSVQVFWMLGDGTLDTGLVVVHAYAEPGVYTAQYTVVDICGTFTGELTVALTFVGMPEINGRDAGIRLQPNPARESARVLWTNAAAGPAELALRDAGGHTVWERRIQLPYGAHAEDIDLSGLPAGAYFLLIRQTGQLWNLPLSVLGK